MSKIRDLRLAHGWTQEELGKMLSVQKAAVSKYEKGIAMPSNEVLKKMSAIFNVSTDYLLDNKFSPDAPVYHLSNEQKKLLKGFDGLNDESKRLILGMIGQLNILHEQIPTTALTL